MNQWEIVAAVLAAGLLPCLWVCVRAGATHGLVALEVASTLLSTTLMALSEGLQRQPCVDLALVFALVAAIGAFAFARFMERDL